MDGTYYIRLAGGGPSANSVTANGPKIEIGPQDPNDPSQVVGRTIEPIASIPINLLGKCCCSGPSRPSPRTSQLPTP